MTRLKQSASLLLMVLSSLFFYACGEDCTPIKQELEEVKSALAARDSILDMIGSTFQAIDSNLLSMRTIETELMGQLSVPNADRNAIRANTDEIRNIMEMNQSYITMLETKLDVTNETSSMLFSIVQSMDEKVRSSNMRLARLNGELTELGDDFKDMFQDYMDAEIANMTMRENLTVMEKDLNTMEAQMNEIKNTINTAYVAIGTKKQLIDQGVLEKGGLLKESDVNENFDKMAFQPYDMREVREFELGSSRAKVFTEHPTESYTIKDGKLIIEAPKLFWSISRYLIVVVD